ncbi:MAG TPA: adenylate/guanylate cyclase domain-containing protein [Desulfatiglandales bacterium]|nr:adenylate/guanylate cyclase domain-containing protein [Desulfatiglandales bacterium]
MDNPSNFNKIDNPLYNSRLIKNYVVYMKEFYPEVKIDLILNHAYINKYELDDEGHWFSQWQVDRFHEALSRETKNPNLPREAGRYMASSSVLSGPFKQYIMGFMTPSAAYWVLKKIVPHLSRAFTLEIKKLGRNKIDVLVRPNPGVIEKHYQCENRCGQFEAIAKVFTDKYAIIDHPTCIHKGGDVCRYIITWEETKSFLWIRLRLYLVSLALLSLVALYFLITPIHYAGLIFLSAFLLMSIVIYAEDAQREELVQNVKEQSNASELLLDEINRRHNDTLLVKEIGQTTSKLLNIDDLMNSVIESMKRLLDFDRGGIWLVNSDNTRLVYKAGYGYEPDVYNILKKSYFHLDNPDSKGVAIQTFKKQRAFLVNDISEIEGNLTSRSLEFIKIIGTRSFVCVPLVYERRSFGIIFVDNIRSKRTLSQTDISLLTGVSRQISISINNAMSYQKLKESKERESNLRKLFERYVPPSVIRRYVSGLDLFKGEEAFITVLFLDIRDFTASTEKMNVVNVVSFLNDYYDRCSAIISEEHGHINKYTGDGFLAIFGAPEPLNNHITMGFNAACRILDLSTEMVMGNVPIQIGIGLHTGRAILGNLGSRTKMEYTAIGDTINTAARLQELTKQFREFPLIMSRDVRDGIDLGHASYKGISNLGLRMIRGKKDTLEIFGFNNHEGHSSIDLKEYYDGGLVPMQIISGV